MESNSLAVISIGYGQRMFDAKDPDRLRMEACAKETKTYNMVVLCRPKLGLHTITGQNGLVINPITTRFLPWKFCRAVMAVRALIKTAKGPVVVTSQDSFETGLIGWVATRGTNAKLNVQEHGDVFGTTLWKDEKMSNFFRFYLGLFILRTADTVRVVSDRIADTLETKGVKRTNIQKLSVMTDAAPFAASQPDPAVRQYFAPNTFIFLSVARFVPQKNLSLMLRAFIQAYQQNNRLRLLLVGDGPDAALVTEIIASSHINQSETIVQILPWTNNVPSFMASVDAYLLTSNYEGWGRVLIEAQYAKLPIVTTDVGCVGEVVFDQVDGAVVPVNDQAALTTALVAISSNTAAYTTLKQNLQAHTLPASVSYQQYAKQWISVLEHTFDTDNT